MKNTGQVDYTESNPANISDDLSQVIDDADFNNDATASSGPAPNYVAPTLSWSGPLAVGQTVTVKYSVTAKSDGQRGDNLAKNTVTGGSNCVSGSEDHRCTTKTGMPWVVDRKSVDPSSGNAVKAGQDLTYTLTFENKGAAAGEVDRVDDLSGVLDDAVIKSAPKVSDSALSATDGSDGKIAVKGTLQPGQQVTVTYTVTVKPDGQRGDNVLGNFLVNPGVTPPTTCEPGNDACTTNPVSWVVDRKSVDPKSGTTVKAGQDLTYTLTFENKGAAAGEVDRVYDLTKVLDDATIKTAPKASDDALSVTDGADGKIAIKGTLQPAQKVTVTYTVTVKPDGQRGDNVLGNFLVNPGTTPPTTCEEGRDDCTSNPVSPTPVDPPTPVIPPTTPVVDPELPSTGAAGIIATLAGGALLAVLGGVILGLARARRRRS